jgi:hypothetical protein
MLFRKKRRESWAGAESRPGFGKLLDDIGRDESVGWFLKEYTGTYNFLVGTGTREQMNAIGPDPPCPPRGGIYSGRVQISQAA